MWAREVVRRGKRRAVRVVRLLLGHRREPVRAMDDHSP
jgi:hypothetical protein